MTLVIAIWYSTELLKYITFVEIVSFAGKPVSRDKAEIPALHSKKKGCISVGMNYDTFNICY